MPFIESRLSRGCKTGWKPKRLIGPLAVNLVVCSYEACDYTTRQLQETLTIIRQQVVLTDIQRRSMHLEQTDLCFSNGDFSIRALSSSLQTCPAIALFHAELAAFIYEEIAR